jgi:hypothetical protein
MRLNRHGSPVEADTPSHSLRMYLYDKYIYRNEEGRNAEAAAGTAEFPVGVPCPAA